MLFGMQSRLFTLLPGMIQILKNTVTLLLTLWVVHLLWHFALPVTGVLALIVVLKIGYTVLFPYLPGRWFAVKGFFPEPCLEWEHQNIVQDIPASVPVAG